MLVKISSETKTPVEILCDFRYTHIIKKIFFTVNVAVVEGEGGPGDESVCQKYEWMGDGDDDMLAKEKMKEYRYKVKKHDIAMLDI